MKKNKKKRRAPPKRGPIDSRLSLTPFAEDPYSATPHRFVM